MVRKVIDLVSEAGAAFGRDKAAMLAAALAYYAIFSLAPLLVISVAVAGRVLGTAAVEGTLVEQIETVVGAETASLIASLISSAGQGSGGLVATVISAVLLLAAASGLFNQLRRALNHIYGVEPEPRQGVGNILFLLRTRFVSTIMVLLMGLLLVASLILNSVLLLVNKFLVELIPGLQPLPALSSQLVTLFVFFVVLVLVLKTLPDAEVAWRDVLLGAAVTTGLFWLGQYLIGLYLSRSTVGSVYGAAGSLIVILLWVYYSAQIVLFGAEITKVYANTYGASIVPAEHAVYIARRYSEMWEEQFEDGLSTLEQEEESGGSGERLANPTTAVRAPDSMQQVRRQAAIGLFGVALGLLIAFIGAMRRK